MGWSEDKITIEDHMKKLNKMLKNLQKAPYRDNRKQTLLDKQKYSDVLNNRISELLVPNEEQIQGHELEFFIKSKRLLYNEINKILSAKIDIIRVWI